MRGGNRVPSCAATAVFVAVAVIVVWLVRHGPFAGVLA